MLAALDHPTAGYSAIAGIDINAARPGHRARLRRRLITHVYQRPADNLLAHLTALQQLTRLRRTGGIDAAEALDALGIGARRNHLPEQLSGGEKQRLALARALVAGHPVVIADEPTSTLDSKNASTVIDALAMLAARGITVLVATHDMRVLPRMHEIVTLRDGAIASITAGGTETAIIDHSGRLQLPPQLRERFPDKRAILEWDEATETLQVRKP
jgi:ABC-type lipoprotein export system ATPase subunit